MPDDTQASTDGGHTPDTGAGTSLAADSADALFEEAFGLGASAADSKPSSNGHTPEAAANEQGSTPDVPAGTGTDASDRLNGEQVDGAGSEDPNATPDAEGAQEAAQGEKVQVELDVSEDGFIFDNGISKYKDFDSLKASHDRLLKDFQARLAAERESEAKENRELAEAKKIAAMYESALPPEQVRQLRIDQIAKELLPEADRDRIINMKADDLADDEEARALLDRARGRAEEKLAAEEAKAEKAQADADDALRQKYQSAAEKVKPLVTQRLAADELQNLEVRNALAQYLKEPVELPDGSSGPRHALIPLIAADEGKDAAMHYLEGMIATTLANYGQQVRAKVEETQTQPKRHGTGRTNQAPKPSGTPVAGDRTVERDNIFYEAIRNQ